MGELPSDVVSQLRLFRSRVRDLLQRRFIQPGRPPLRIRLSSEDDGFLTGVDEEDFRAFLSTFRQFHLKDDLVLFGAICNLIERHCDRADLKERARASRALWKDVLEVAPLNYRVDGKLCKIRDILDMSIYDSGRFHSRNLDKLLAMEGLDQQTKNFQEYTLCSAIDFMVQALRDADAVIRDWLGEEGD